jgi:hypothetical protein
MAALTSGRHFRGGHPAYEPTPKTATDGDGERHKAKDCLIDRQIFEMR